MVKKRQAQHVSRETIFDNMENSAADPTAGLCFFILLLLSEIIFER